jgi:hypothetical protein
VHTDVILTPISDIASAAVPVPAAKEAGPAPVSGALRTI